MPYLREIIPLDEHIFYSHWEPPGEFKNEQDPDKVHKYVLKHHTNLAKLRKMAKEPAHWEHRHQVEKEIGIAHRKIAYWEKHPKYNHEAVKDQIHAINQQHGPSREERLKSKYANDPKIKAINQAAKEAAKHDPKLPEKAAPEKRPKGVTANKRGSRWFRAD